MSAPRTTNSHQGRSISNMDLSGARLSRPRCQPLPSARVRNARMPPASHREDVFLPVEQLLDLGRIGPHLLHGFAQLRLVAREALGPPRDLARVVHIDQPPVGGHGVEYE